MKTRREWVELCKITHPEIGKNWEKVLKLSGDSNWNLTYASMAICLDSAVGGLYWDVSGKGLQYWIKIYKDMLNNPSKYETLPQGEISPSMGVNTKPAYKLKYKGYWIDIDPNMPSEMVEQLKECINTDIEALRNRIKADEVHINNLITQNHAK